MNTFFGSWVTPKYTSYYCLLWESPLKSLQPIPKTHFWLPCYGSFYFGIAFLSTIVWGHHMFISGMNPFLGSVFTFTTLLIAIPSAVKAFNYITTLWKGNLQLNPAMLFSIGLVSTFISGGLTGIILGDSTLDINVHDTYFVVAHFHLVMGISALYGLFAGVYHWFPKMFKRMMNKNLGYVHFWVTAVCAYGVFFPMHFIGMAGLPRRYYTNTPFLILTICQYQCM